jgi:hypothetical protein
MNTLPSQLKNMVEDKVRRTLIIFFDCTGDEHHKSVSPGQTDYQQHYNRTSTHCFSRDRGKRRTNAGK